MPHLTESDRKGLWALLWRVLVFGPFVWVAGVALLLLVAGAFFLPPVYAAAAFYGGDWITGAAALVPWLVVLRYRRPILSWVFEGVEHGDV